MISNLCVIFIFFTLFHVMINKVMFMKNILLVEDDRSIAYSLKEALENRHYYVQLAFNKQQAIEVFHPYIDLIILDIQLPDGNGIDFCREIRMQYATPILFLSCLNNEETIVKGLNAGGDDYICKPFGIRELCARIECILRRIPDKEGIYYIKDLIIDKKQRKVLKNHEELELSLITFVLLESLIESHGRVLTRDYLLMLIEDTTKHEIEDNTLTVHMKRLRKALGTYENQTYIETLRGVGYRWKI